jgi:CheY-like chemotaxis protein
MLLQKKRIFVVEDNLENRMIMRFLLTYHGAIVEFDMWGRTTVEKLRSFAPVDIILMDLMLPLGSSGYQITSEIRAHAELAKVPIVAVSASDPSQAIPLCRQKGFDGFIAKPIDDELFPQQILRILNHEPVWYAGVNGMSS